MSDKIYAIDEIRNIALKSYYKNTKSALGIQLSNCCWWWMKQLVSCINTWIKKLEFVINDKNSKYTTKDKG